MPLSIRWPNPALPYPESELGYGHSSQDVAAFVLEDPELLTGYHDAVHALTLSVLDEIGYDGWLAMECGLSGPAEEVLPSVPRLLRTR